MMLFTLGRIVATPGALEACQNLGVDPLVLVGRHVSGDWGDLDAEDQRANDRAVGEWTRIFSAYVIGPGVKIWIITEADRSSTTLLLPSEY